MAYISGEHRQSGSKTKPTAPKKAAKGSTKQATQGTSTTQFWRKKK